MFCPHTYDQVHGASKPPNADIIFIPIPDEVRNVLVEFKKATGSRIFRSTWLEVSEQYHEANPNVMLSLTDVITEIYQPAVIIVEKLAHGVKSNTIPLHEVDRFFHIYRDHYDVLKDELKVICPAAEKVLDERVEQIKDYHTIRTYRQGAITMIKIRDKFRLKGDFSLVEALIQLVSIIVSSVAVIYLVNVGRLSYPGSSCRYFPLRTGL